uniref:Uncharacterized protein n=1 Tax=Ciona savignyi TaxID=51511 RepID=H2Y599_CIOSA
MENSNEKSFNFQGQEWKCPTQNSAFAKKAKMQHEKTETISKGSEHQFGEDSCSYATNDIQLKLKDLFTRPSDHIKPDKLRKVGQTSNNFAGVKKKTKQTSPMNDVRLPMLTTSYDVIDSHSDDMDDSDSEFFPDCSSVDSHDSNDDERCYSNDGRSCIARETVDDVYLEEHDVLHLSDDELIDEQIFDHQMAVDEAGFSGIFNHVTQHQPIPAAGNDVPGTSSDTPPPPNDIMREKLENNIKPQALRRVKSMVLDHDLEDGIATGKRMFVMQKKLNNDCSMTSVPSPLLSNYDVTVLQSSPSQVSNNNKFGLKRSRSNISVKMTPYKRGGISLLKEEESIPEELDDEP